MDWIDHLRNAAADAAMALTAIFTGIIALLTWQRDRRRVYVSLNPQAVAQGDEAVMKIDIHNATDGPVTIAGVTCRPATLQAELTFGYSPSGVHDPIPPGDGRTYYLHLSGDWSASARRGPKWGSLFHSSSPRSKPQPGHRVSIFIRIRHSSSAVFTRRHAIKTSIPEEIVTMIASK